MTNTPETRNVRVNTYNCNPHECRAYHTLYGDHADGVVMSECRDGITQVIYKKGGHYKIYTTRGTSADVINTIKLDTLLETRKAAHNGIQTADMIPSERTRNA